MVNSQRGSLGSVGYYQFHIQQARMESLFIKFGTLVNLEIIAKFYKTTGSWCGKNNSKLEVTWHARRS